MSSIVILASSRNEEFACSSVEVEGLAEVVYTACVAGKCVTAYLRVRSIPPPIDVNTVGSL